MRLLLVLLPVCLLAQNPSLGLLTGTWVNQRETGGTTRVSFRSEGGRTIVHAWGSCTPVDCDQGEADAELWNGIPMAVWKHGFSTSRMQFVPLPDGRLIVAVEKEYNDGSNRKDPGRAEFFARRESVQEGPEVLAARSLLHQVAERYRSLPPSYFEAVSTETRSTSKSEVRTARRSKIYAAPPDRFRVETEGRGESSILILDGETEWRVYPTANEYLTNPQAKGAPAGSPFSEFAILDQTNGEPRITGQEDVEGARCTVVRIAMEHGVNAQVWIDNTTHLVRKHVFDEGKAKSEVSITVVRLGEASAADLFRYDPAAAGAKNRRELAHAAPESLTGKTAPDFTLRDLDGREIRLSALRGKPVLLDFWATWCGYCRQALPSIELLHRSLKDKVTVLGVDNEAPELAREYLQKFGYTLPTLADINEQVVSLYHLDGWPTTVVIDRDGKIVYYEVGFEAEKLRDALRAVGVW